jgi:hypothetical protein
MAQEPVLWSVSKEAALALRALIAERTLDIRPVSPECYRRRPRGLRPTRHEREQKTPRWFPAGLFIHGQTPVGIPPWARSNPA